MEAYLIKNVVNGKAYIGQTKGDSGIRFLAHCSDARNGCQFRLHKAIREFGESAFRLAAIVRVGNRDQLNEAEKMLIEEFSSTDVAHGYNMTCGGYGTRKAKESLKGRKHAPDCEHCRKSKLANQGLRRSRETIEKLRFAAKRRWSSRAERDKQSQRKIGSIPWNKGISSRISK